MSFHACKQEDLLYFQSDLIHQNHGFTTRLGGVSTGYLASMNLGVRRGDTPENVEQNISILGSSIGFDPHKVVFSVQVHRDDVRLVTPQDWGKGLYAHTDYGSPGQPAPAMPAGVVRLWALRKKPPGP